MPRIVIDLTNYVNTFGDLVPAGRYRVKVFSVEITKTKEKQQLMLCVLFQIVAGEHEGKSISTNVMLEGKGQFRSVELLSALGLSTARKRLQFDTDTWIGKHLEVDTDIREYNGRESTDVRGFLPVVQDTAPQGGTLDDFLPAQETPALAPVTAPVAPPVSPITAAATEAGITEADVISTIKNLDRDAGVDLESLGNL